MTDTPANGIKNEGYLPGWFLFLRKIVDAVTIGLNVLGTLLIVAIMVLVNADVIGRGMFDNSISGVPEIVSMSIVAIVFLQVAQTFRKGKLTRTDAVLGFVQKRAPRIRIALDFLFSLAAIMLIWQILTASTPLFWKSWIRNTYEGTVGDFTAPIWPVKLIILIGCAALLVQLLMFAAEAGLKLIAKSGATE